MSDGQVFVILLVKLLDFSSVILSFSHLNQKISPIVLFVNLSIWNYKQQDWLPYQVECLTTIHWSSFIFFRFSIFLGNRFCHRDNVRRFDETWNRWTKRFGWTLFWSCRNISNLSQNSFSAICLEYGYDFIDIQSTLFIDEWFLTFESWISRLVLLRQMPWLD